MNTSSNKILKATIMLLLVASFTSCVKKEFDEPPTGGEDPVMTGTQTSIAALKALYSGTAVKVTSDIYIVGSVIADDQSGNFYKELVIQDSTGGISILLDQSNYYTTYKIGRRIFVKCNGLYLEEYNGLVQLGSGVDNTGSLTRIAQTLIPEFLLPGSYYHYVTPKTIHIAQINASNYAVLVNTLVTLDTTEFVYIDTTFANGTLKQDRNLFLKQCISPAQLTIRSSGYSSFAEMQVPTGNGKIIGVLQIYNSNSTWELTDMQLKIRDLADISFTGLRCDQIPVGVLNSLNEDFESQSNNVDIAISGWINVAIAGTRKWQGKLFSGNTYAQATAFSSGLPSMESWLITPELNLSVADTLIFESATAFWTHNGLSIWISTDFDGTDISSATWTQLSCNLATSGDPNYTFETSGIIDLNAFSGTGYIAFKYVGSDPGQTATYQIDNVVVH